MTRLIRLIALTAAAALTISGLIVAFTVVGVGLYKNTATADAMPLPPLSSTALGGSTVYAADGTTVLGTLHASQTRKPIQLSQISKLLITAVLDTEDHRFFQHGGFDIPSTIRALSADSSSSGGIQGGSTIAQQLVKQTYLSSERTLSRKIKEAVLADRLERQYSKDQILQAYLNTIYLGNGAYGVEAAANSYFHTTASQLTLPEAALLAGLIQSPTGYDPIFEPVAARTRRSEVLSRMLYYKDITPAQAAAANATALPTASPAPPAATNDGITGYYVQEVESELLGNNSPLGGTYDERYQEVFEGGLKIYTNLNPTLQAEAEQTVAADTPSDPRGFEQGLVSIDPTTGKVLALVGGTGGQNAQFDIMVDGRRQPGSGFKLFTLLAALEQGYSIYDTLDGQSPCAIDFPTDHDLVSHPANNDEGDGGGVMTLLNATAQSTNCAFIRLAHEVGLSSVISMAHQLGISESLPPYPSIVIGSIPVHPIEMAAAYAAMADDGVYHVPSFISRILDRSGSTVYNDTNPGKQVVPAQIASEANVAFQAVLTSGTGTAGALGRPAAGKTGTTSNYYDAWFNGYTPQLETTVWMGNPNTNISMTGVGYVGTVYGGTYPTFTWRDFMNKALANDPPVEFPQPDYNSLPAPVYITSPGLVRDDVLDHNYVYVPPPTPTTIPGAVTTPGATTTPTTAAPTATTTPTARTTPGPPATGTH